jgi:hypothetical protein
VETLEQRELTRQALGLYQRFGRPLEAEHRGQYVAISRDGQYVLAPSSTEALIEGAAQFGPGNFIFKVGDIAAEVWK